MEQWRTFEPDPLSVSPSRDRPQRNNWYWMFPIMTCSVSFISSHFPKVCKCPESMPFYWLVSYIAGLNGPPTCPHWCFVVPLSPCPLSSPNKNWCPSDVRYSQKCLLSSSIQSQSAQIFYTVCITLALTKPKTTKNKTRMIVDSMFRINWGDLKNTA